MTMTFGVMAESLGVVLSKRYLEIPVNFVQNRLKLNSAISRSDLPSSIICLMISIFSSVLVFVFVFTCLVAKFFKEIPSPLK